MSRHIQEYIQETQKWEGSLGGQFRFETISWLGRTFGGGKPKVKREDENLLHLGSGHNPLEGWVNADFFNYRLKFWAIEEHPDWMLDLRYPLKCDDNVWDGVFTEHTFEHIHPHHVFNMLRELHRTMKPGAWLRIVVPDVEKYVNYYQGTQNGAEFAKWPNPTVALRTISQNFFHVSLWDGKLFTEFLEEAGFVNVEKVDFMQGSDARLLVDNPERQWESLYMEAQKPE